jgi:hypothetical protein
VHATDDRHSVAAIVQAIRIARTWHVGGTEASRTW